MTFETSRARAASSHVSIAPGWGLSLDWTGPAGCPDAQNIAGRVEALLGPPPRFAPGRLDVVARVRDEDTSDSTVEARRENTGMQNEGGTTRTLVLDLETVQGPANFRRQLRADACEELADAAALVIALALNPQLKVDAPTKSPAAHSAPWPPGLGPWRFWGGFSARGDAGTLPSPSVGPELAVGMGVQWFEVGLRASWAPPQRQHVSQSPDRGGDFQWFGAALVPCVVPWRAAFGAGLCAGIEVGSLAADGFGTAFDTRTSNLWIAASGALLLRYEWTRVIGMELRTEGFVPFTRPEFLLTNVGNVHQPASVGVRLALGMRVHFP